jgi:hypothetical protein
VINLEKTHILGEVYKVVIDNNRNLRNIWGRDIVFTWRWWFELALAVLPWVIWIKIRDKDNSVRLLFVGLVVAIITNTMDMIGVCMGMWYYDYKIIPMTVIYIPWDYSLFPVSMMLLLQYKPKVNIFIKAIGFAAICAFVFEPLFSWMDLYVRLK